VVPRDVNVEAVQRPEESHLPLQPTDMDERVTVPQGAVAPEEFSPLPQVSEELVEPDILQTGEVAFLTPERPGQGSFGDAITRVISIALHILLALFLIFEPKIFGPHVRTNEEEEIARRQITVLLPPGALDSLRPSPRTAPVPHESVSVDPNILRRVAPPIEPPLLRRNQNHRRESCLARRYRSPTRLRRRCSRPRSQRRSSQDTAETGNS